MYNLISFSGIFIIIGLGWLISTNRRILNWRLIVLGVLLQLVFAVLFFTIPAGTKFFLIINDLVIKVVDASAEGSKFVFGSLALPPGVQGSPGFILAFQALPTIIFFSALVSILYYLNIMPFFIRVFAGLFSRLLKISGAEALSAASNIFVGVESAFVVRPHIMEMTRSELCTLLAAGMSTVASNVLALYVFTLKAQFPTIAGHLISASILSAIAAIVMSKVLLPEEEVPKTLGVSIKPHYEKDSNIFEAIINGALAGVKVIVGVVALLIAVLGLIALLDLILSAIGLRINSLFSINIDWSLKGLLGYLFYPLTLILGIPLSEVSEVAKIIGERTIATEVAGYQDLAKALAQHTIVNPRTAIITSYALCGFAHLASLAIFVGGVSALAPSKTKELSQIGFRALIAATFACLMTACVAGTFISQNTILFGK